jgi:branched-chain amino acid transport system ATP-binding protein
MLVVQNICIDYGKIRVIHSLSFKVEKGEIVCILGANGAGKSTILRALSGLKRPQSGSIKFQGREITKVAPHDIVKAGMAHVPEGRQIFPDLSVKENLSMGAFLRKDKIKVLEDQEWVLSLFPKLRERYSQMGGTLSGGEQQMLAIARGLMGRPSLLILDEPSLGLAPIIVENIFKIIKSLNQEGMTILLVEQNTRLSLAIARRAYVLEAGAVKLEGDAKELANNAKVKEAYLGG